MAGGLKPLITTLDQVSTVIEAMAKVENKVNTANKKANMTMSDTKASVPHMKWLKWAILHSKKNSISSGRKLNHRLKST